MSSKNPNQSTPNASASTKQPPSNKKGKWALLLILLLLLLTFFIQWKLRNQIESPSVPKTPQDSLVNQVDSARILDSLKQDSLRRDSLNALRLDSLRQDSLKNAEANRTSTDKIGGKNGSASGTFTTESTPKEDETKALLEADTIAPTLSLNPVSGRYFDQVELSASCQDYTTQEGAKVEAPGCQIQIALLDLKAPEPKDLSQVEFKPFSPVKFTKDQAVLVRAIDSSKNSSAPLFRKYQIVPRTSICGKNSVPVGGVTQDGPAKGFCVDQYEWPNEEGEKPKAFTSQLAAVEACQSVGKRLCSADEWKWACQGPEQTKYPYGQSFEASYCTTSASTPGRAGRKKSCRSWYGAYDMGGNVWEWTSTPSPKRNKYFIVSGGSWNSVNQTSCGTTKYSFFPQNEYPMVGFRCCSDQK